VHFDETFILRCHIHCCIAAFSLLCLKAAATISGHEYNRGSSMLQIHNKRDAVNLAQPANDQLVNSATRANASTIALDAANDDAAIHVISETSVEQPSPTSSWLQDWTSAWTAAASSMIDASAASFQAIGTISSATVAKPETKPEVSLWSLPARTERPRSWYRPPQANLLDPTAWGFPAPFAVYGVPVTPQMAMAFNPITSQGWSPFTAMMPPSAMPGWRSFGLPLAQPSPYANPFARTPENPMTAWMSSFAPQPVSPWAGLTKAMTGALAPATYSSYRSDSGHAVAQIAEPATKSSPAQEAVVAIMNLFAWPMLERRH
jgi:hypothetical protein